MHLNLILICVTGFILLTTLGLEKPNIRMRMCIITYEKITKIFAGILCGPDVNANIKKILFGMKWQNEPFRCVAKFQQ